MDLKVCMEHDNVHKSNHMATQRACVDVPGKEYFWKTWYNEKKEQEYKINMTVSSMMNGIILLILNLK